MTAGGGSSPVQAAGWRARLRDVTAQHDLELIVLRQAASHLATPIFIVDDAGSLLYFNEPAEQILGQRYDETGSMSQKEWGSVFTPVDDDGQFIEPGALPLAIAIRERHPATGIMNIVGLDGVARRIEVTAIPLIGQSGHDLGSLAIFWESKL